MAADRFDRKRLMIASDAIRALLLAMIPVALWFSPIVLSNRSIGVSGRLPVDGLV